MVPLFLQCEQCPMFAVSALRETSDKDPQTMRLLGINGVDEKDGVGGNSHACTLSVKGCVC
eukprot:9547279-Prorocentrum_lima.AAC.1